MTSNRSPSNPSSESKRASINSLCPTLRFDEDQIEQLFAALDNSGEFAAPTGEISIAFLDEESIATVHGDFMDDPTPTDVITFPGDPECELAGEICVCPPIAQSYAAAAGLSFSDELALYLIHGYLHLCGYDDIEDADRAAMRAAEQRALALARAANALPHFQL